MDARQLLVRVLSPIDLDTPDFCYTRKVFRCIALAILATAVMHLVPTSSAFGVDTAPIIAEVKATGVIDCFPEGLIYPDGKVDTDTGTKPFVFCESSAVLAFGDNLIIASDKEVPDDGLLSPVFVVPRQALLEDFHVGVDEISFQRVEPFIDIRKVEAFAADPGGEIFFATSSFSWRPESNPAAVPYNTLLYWDSDSIDENGNIREVGVVEPSESDGVVSSKDLWSPISESLAKPHFPLGPGYFKIEGLAVLPDSKLLFGIRATGDSYTDYFYTVTFIVADYTYDGSTVQITRPFLNIYELDVRGVDGLSEPIGLSSLDYDARWDRLLFTTSVEPTNCEGEDCDLAAYIWAIQRADFFEGRRPILLRSCDGQPVRLPHKSEGLTMLDDQTLLLIHDDDDQLRPINTQQVQQTRMPHQGIFSTVELLHNCDEDL